MLSVTFRAFVILLLNLNGKQNIATKTKINLVGGVFPSV